MRYIWMVVAVIAFIALQVALADIRVFDQHGKELNIELVVTVPESVPSLPQDPVPESPAEPVEQGDVVAAIKAMAPAQHATQAVFKKIPGSEVDSIMYCVDWASDPNWQAAVEQSGSTTTPDDLKCFIAWEAFTAWVGGAWNWDNYELNVPAGGGHGDFGGNQLHVAKLVNNTGILEVDWQMPIGPQPLTHGRCGATVYGPSADHTYAGPVYVESQNEVWHWAGTGPYPKTSYCDESATPTAPSAGGWTTDGVTWTQRHAQGSIKVAYPRGCYLPDIDRIVMLGTSKRYLIDPSDYSTQEIPLNVRGYVSTVGSFDTAAHGDICYEYIRDRGIKGIRYDHSGAVETTFTGQTQRLIVPSLSVERSTGNLVIVGLNGYAMHIDVQTGIETDISAPTGITSTKGRGYLFGKFDMVPDVPCVGIGTDDARDGLWLVTLPSSVCAIGGQQQASIEETITPETTDAEQLPVDLSSEFEERCQQPGVVFCDPLSTHGPYVVSDGVMEEVPNPKGGQGIPESTWWKSWRRLHFTDGNAAGYDPDLDALKLVKTDRNPSSGLLMTNFSPDYSVQFKEGDTFSVEFEFRYNCEALYLDCDPESLTYQTDRRPFIHRETGRTQGAKIAIIAEGAVPAALNAPACHTIQVVPNSDYGTVRAFHDCGKYLSMQKYTGEHVKGSRQYERNTGKDYSCLRYPITDPKTGESFEAGGTGPNCAYLEPDQWMRLKAVVHVGTWNKPDTRFQLFFAHEGHEYGEVIDHMITVRPPKAPYVGYGAVHLQMHSTKSQTGVGDPDRIAWYRNLIVAEL